MRGGWAAALAATALTAACSRPAEPPGTLSADDERRLNEAAEMLDANAAGATVATADDDAAPDDNVADRAADDD